MRISALEEYGLRCLLTLVNQGKNSHLTIPEIAQQEGLSIPYASKLLSILRKAKLVQAVRGRTGGFRLARKPDEINLLEVITALGGPLIEPGHCTKYSGLMETCVHLDNCSVKYILSGLAGYIGDYLSMTTLVDVVNGDFLQRIKRIESKVDLSSHKTNIDNNHEVEVLHNFENIKPLNKSDKQIQKEK